MTHDCRAAEPEADREAGFTLIELLVALALFSLLVTLLFDNVRAGLQAWRHGSQYAEDLGRRANVQDSLRRLIGNLYPLAVADRGGVPRIEFEGTKEHVTFLGNAPTVVGAGSKFRYKVYADRQQGRTDLVLSATPELASSGDASAATKSLLLPDIIGAEFSYYGDATDERRPKWLDGWSQRSEAPKLVRLRVSFRPDDARSWPELLIAPRILADVGCIYDPATKRCRGR